MVWKMVMCELSCSNVKKIFVGMRFANDHKDTNLGFFHLNALFSLNATSSFVWFFKFDYCTNLQTVFWILQSSRSQKFTSFLFQLDLTRPLDEQGHFDIIVHKLTDLLATADLCRGSALCVRNMQVGVVAPGVSCRNDHY